MTADMRTKAHELLAPARWMLFLAAAVFVLALTARFALDLPALIAPMMAEAQEAEPTPLPPAPTSTPSPTATPTPFPTVEATPEPTATPTVTLLPPTPEPTPQPPYLVAGAEGTNVRRGPSTAFDKVGYLTPRERAEITGRSSGWWQIAYEGGTGWVYRDIVSAFNVAEVPVVQPPRLIPEPEFPPPEAIDEGRWIDVDLSEQRLTAYEGRTPVRSYLVSTGLPATPTPVGQFRIWIKLRYHDMSGPDYYIEDVPFVMYFHEGYGLHGVIWHGNFGHPMSHGCVNQPTAEAEWLFNFADVGTLVNIHE